MNKRNLFNYLFFVLASFYAVSIQAQSSSGGNLSIGENGVMYIYGEHDFAKGSGFVPDGTIKTNRIGSKGYLNFTKGSSWKGATPSQFVDGYVSVLHEEDFTFPIGHGAIYRPVAITGAEGTTAAYYYDNAVRPSSKIVKNGVDRISNKEYWDLKGTQSTNIYLSWGQESNIKYITNEELGNLTIIGLKDGIWMPIASKILPSIPTNLLQEANGKDVESSFSLGAIATVDPIVPNDYTYLTLGTREGTATVVTDNKLDIKLFPNPVVKDVYVDITKLGIQNGKIIIHSMTGQRVTERIINDQSEGIQHFDVSDYANGMHEISIKAKDQVVSRKFMVEKDH